MDGHIFRACEECGGYGDREMNGVNAPIAGRSYVVRGTPCGGSFHRDILEQDGRSCRWNACHVDRNGHGLEHKAMIERIRVNC